MTTKRLDGQMELLLQLLRFSYGTFSWHGPNLVQALSGVGWQQAAWRPAGEAPVWNIHEVTLHAADVMQKCGADLFGAQVVREVNQDAFPLAGITTEEEWRLTLEFLQQSYATLEKGL